MSLKDTFDKQLIIYRNTTDINNFLKFFRKLNKESPDKTMQLYHIYYNILKNQFNLIPDIYIFNQLIQSILYSEPPKYKFIKYFLNEMTYYNLTISSNIVHNILRLIKRYPHQNQLAADNWYNYWQKNLDKQVNKNKKWNVMSVYFEILVKSEQVEKAQKFKKELEEIGIWDNTFNEIYKLLPLYSV